jgi:hypothetical protein
MKRVGRQGPPQDRPATWRCIVPEGSLGLFQSLWLLHRQMWPCRAQDTGIAQRWSLEFRVDLLMGNRCSVRRPQAQNGLAGRVIELQARLSF